MVSVERCEGRREKKLRVGWDVYGTCEEKVEERRKIRKLRSKTFATYYGENFEKRPILLTSALLVLLSPIARLLLIMLTTYFTTVLDTTA